MSYLINVQCFTLLGKYVCQLQVVSYVAWFLGLLFSPYRPHLGSRGEQSSYELETG